MARIEFRIQLSLGYTKNEFEQLRPRLTNFERELSDLVPMSFVCKCEYVIESSEWMNVCKHYVFLSMFSLTAE